MTVTATRGKMMFLHGQLLCEFSGKMTIKLIGNHSTINLQVSNTMYV